ncbi:MAG: GNAT family N-acetyltransferase [Segetibacter sp.]
MQLKIEPVKRSEVKMLSAISTSCFYDTYHEQNSKDDIKLFIEKSFNTKMLKHEMSLHVNYFFFARTANEIAGYIKLSNAEVPQGSKEMNALEIARIYVMKDKIGSGVGKTLIEFAFFVCKEASQPKNLVRSMGAQQTGYWFLS